MKSWLRLGFGRAFGCRCRLSGPRLSFSDVAQFLRRALNVVPTYWRYRVAAHTCKMLGCLSVCLSVCLSLCKSTLCACGIPLSLSLSLSVCLSACLSVCLSVCLFVCLSVDTHCVPAASRSLELEVACSNCDECRSRPHLWPRWGGNRHVDCGGPVQVLE